MLLLGLGIFVSGPQLFVQLYQTYYSDQNIWWTFSETPLSIEETTNHFELRIAGDLLQQCLADGTLFIKNPQGEIRPVAGEEISVRLNNWPFIKSRHLAVALLPAFFLGLSIAFVLMGGAEWYSIKRQARSKDASGV